MNPNIVITVEIRMPLIEKPMYTQVQVGPEFFAPVPFDPDLPRALSKQYQAVLQKKRRADVTRWLGLQLAEKIKVLTETKDPQIGGSPEQWCIINARYAYAEAISHNNENE